MERQSRVTRGYDENGNFYMTQYGKIEEMSRAFDIEFWQTLDSTARFRAVEEMVEYYLHRKGRDDERRLQRTVVSLQRIER